MQRKRPSGEKPTSWPGEKILSNVTSQWSLSIFLTGYWFGASLLNWRKATGSKFFSASRMTWPPHSLTTVDAQRPVGCQMVPSAPQRPVDVVAGDGSLLDEQFAHRHHFPFDLLALGAEIVVFAGRRIGIDLGNLEHAALLPAVGEVADIGHPVVFERRDHARGAPVEARRDVLLSVGDEIAFGSLGIDGHVDAEPKAGRLRDVFHQLHLRAVIADAVDVEAFAPASRCWWECRRSGHSCRPGCC